jgi:hypothetical protein
MSAPRPRGWHGRPRGSHFQDLRIMGFLLHTVEARGMALGTQIGGLLLGVLTTCDLSTGQVYSLASSSSEIQ